MLNCISKIKIAKFAKRIIRRKRLENQAFHYAKNILKSGIYVLPYNSNEIVSIRKASFTFNNLFHIHINNGLNRKIASNADYVKFNYGSGKFIVFTNSYVYGFFKYESLYEYAKNNYIEYYDKFNYPHVKIHSYIDMLKCVVIQNISGIEHNDYYHDSKIVESLLKFGKTAFVKLNPSGKLYFLQHGDAKRANVLWKEDSFIFVDLDGLHFLPPLFDVFHYLCGSGYNLRKIILLLEQSQDLVNEICVKAGINGGNMLDNLFYEYINYYVSQINGYYGDFSFLTIDNTKDFPKTNQLLRSIITE